MQQLEDLGDKGAEMLKERGIQVGGSAPKHEGVEVKLVMPPGSRVCKERAVPLHQPGLAGGQVGQWRVRGGSEVQDGRGSIDEDERGVGRVEERGQWGEDCS